MFRTIFNAVIKFVFVSTVHMLQVSELIVWFYSKKSSSLETINCDFEEYKTNF